MNNSDHPLSWRGGLTPTPAMTVALGICILNCANPLWAYVPGHFYHDGHTAEKVIALTFDDGPGRTTPAILDLLKQHHIQATFFMEGSQIEGFPRIAKQVVEQGHEVGNHTYNHFNFNSPKHAFPDRLVHELKQTEAALKRAAGIQTNIVRLPYGAYGKRNRSWLLSTLKEHGYALVHWSYGEDWLRDKTTDQLIADYLAHAKPGAVFLFHDGGRHREKTLIAVTAVINALEKKGYRFITAEEMFKKE